MSNTPPRSPFGDDNEDPNSPFLYSGGRVNDPYSGDPFGNNPEPGWYDDDPNTPDPAAGQQPHFGGPAYQDPYGGTAPVDGYNEPYDEDGHGIWQPPAKAKGGLASKLPILAVAAGLVIFAVGGYLLFKGGSDDQIAGPITEDTSVTSTTTGGAATTEGTNTTIVQGGSTTTGGGSTTTTTTEPDVLVEFPAGSPEEVAGSFSKKYLGFVGVDGETAWNAGFATYVTDELKGRIQENYAGWMTEAIRKRSATVRVNSIEAQSGSDSVYFVNADVFPVDTSTPLPTERRVLQITLTKVAGSFKVADVVNAES